MTNTDGNLAPSPDSSTHGKAWLLVIAAPKEAQAVVRGLGGGCELTSDWSAQEIAPGFDAVLSGVGKANAAGATARALDLDRHRGVISLGIGGCLPGNDGSFALEIGACVVGSASVYGDEGVQLDEGWASMAERGFGPAAGTAIATTHDGMGVAGDPTLRTLCKGITDHGGEGVIATVSACSGSDAAARAVAARTGATIEAMEGAAVGFTVARVSGGGVPFIELRVVSNTTGRDQRWDLPGSLEKLTGLTERLAGVLTG